MRFEFFHVPVFSDGNQASELNQFLASHRVLSFDRQFVADGANSHWAICVTWMDGVPTKATSKGSKDRSKVDYRDLLPETEFRVFAILRSLRKEIAEQEGVPAYALFTNEQLASIVRGRVISLAKLSEIDGVGPARIEKYGPRFLGIMKKELSSLEAMSGGGHDEKNSHHA